MRRHQSYVLILVLGVISVFLSGCGGGGGSGSQPVVFGQGNGSTRNFNLYSLLQSGGVWHNADVSGEVVGNGYLNDCNPDTDSGCMLKFGAASDGSSGWALIDTDAVSSTTSTEWAFTGASDTNCPSGASSGTEYVMASTYGSQGELTCGATDPVDGTIEPSECTVTYVNGQLYQGCPSSLEMIASGVTYPTDHPLDISYYDMYGNAMGYEQDTAASSTIVNFSAPTNWGINVITVTDPATNLVLSGAGYTLDECLVTIDPPNNSSTYCPY